MCTLFLTEKGLLFTIFNRDVRPQSTHTTAFQQNSTNFVVSLHVQM